MPGSSTGSFIDTNVILYAVSADPVKAGREAILRDGGTHTLWSEDMQDGMVIESRPRIANPFG